MYHVHTNLTLTRAVAVLFAATFLSSVPGVYSAFDDHQPMKRTEFFQQLAHEVRKKLVENERTVDNPPAAREAPADGELRDEQFPAGDILPPDLIFADMPINGEQLAAEGLLSPGRMFADSPIADEQFPAGGIPPPDHNLAAYLDGCIDLHQMFNNIMSNTRFRRRRLPADREQRRQRADSAPADGVLRLAGDQFAADDPLESYANGGSTLEDEFGDDREHRSSAPADREQSKSANSNRSEIPSDEQKREDMEFDSGPTEIPESDDSNPADSDHRAGTRPPHNEQRASMGVNVSDPNKLIIYQTILKLGLGSNGELVDLASYKFNLFPYKIVLLEELPRRKYYNLPDLGENCIRKEFPMPSELNVQRSLRVRTYVESFNNESYKCIAVTYCNPDDLLTKLLRFSFKVDAKGVASLLEAKVIDLQFVSPQSIRTTPVRAPIYLEVPDPQE